MISLKIQQSPQKIGEKNANDPDFISLFG